VLQKVLKIAQGIFYYGLISGFALERDPKKAVYLVFATCSLFIIQIFPLFGCSPLLFIPPSEIYGNFFLLFFCTERGMREGG
jgi:hypothetical protein